MERKRKSKIEFRYYKMPLGSPVLALLGKKWIQTYGVGVDCLHFHNYMEIGYCYEGQGILTIGGKDYRFSGNHFSVIPQNCPHITVSDEGTVSRWEFLYVDVDEILNGIYFSDSSGKKKERAAQRINSKGIFCDAKDFPEMADKVLQMLNIMRKAEEFYLEEIGGITAAFLAALARKNQDNNREVKEDKKVLISDALDYISDHYMESIRIEKLAEFCHISETHFRRIFSSYMNMGPLEYINLIRIRNACELLRKTDSQVADIAFRCGFSTLSTFNRNFRSVTGCSPVEWRKRPENFEQQMLRFEVHPEEGW